MDEALNRLAALAGIEDGWWDFFGNWRVVPPETKRTFLAAMGFHVDSDAEAAKSLREFEERPWRRWLEPVTVLIETEAPQIAVTVAADRDGCPFDWTLDLPEEELVHRGRAVPADLPLGEERDIGDATFRRRLLELPSPLPLGYHRLRIRFEDQGEASTSVIVAPTTAYEPEPAQRGQRLWGIATQVYALRSPRDWGLGDYTDLAELCRGAAALGAASVGINPLHALFPSQPERFGPYAPSSRMFVNVAYLDVEAIPDFADSAEARKMVAKAAFKRGLEALRRKDLVDYAGVARHKMPVLEAVYRSFRRHHLDGDRGHAFRLFQRQGGRPAELFATFEALQEHFLARDPHLGYWRHWPEEYRHPALPAVQAFAGAERERVEFFWYLQWQAEAQLATAQEACRTGGMPVGLYRDVGVGIAGDGGEAWARQEILSLGVTVGAPPDPLAPNGQDWGLTPFNPVAIREAAYAPFIEMLRANMRHAGALRLDHAMQLQRLYWVPTGVGADEGAYLRYPMRDLFALTALESRRNQCLVIGEDLGTVPEGFRERMFGTGLYGYRPLVFERNQDATFKLPDAYIDHALVSAGTHDLPSLKGWWRDIDIETRERLHLFPRAEQGEEERRNRQMDRERLVWAMRQEGLLPDDFPTRPDLSDEGHERLADAVHLFLCRARSRIMMVQPEDVLGLAMQFNLPGTTDQHANWRYRYPLDVAAMLADERLRRLAGRLCEERSG